ncbi:unnamed protein product, partial [Candidula unifasciata]
FASLVEFFCYFKSVTASTMSNVSTPSFSCTPRRHFDNLTNQMIDKQKRMWLFAMTELFR